MANFQYFPVPVKFLNRIFAAAVLLALLIPLSVQADSQPAPDSYIGGHVQFCPKGKVFGDSSCSTLETSMNDAIDDAYDAAQNNISGTIYIEGGNYSGDSYDTSGNEIYIQGFNFGTSLVIQGGIGSGTTTFVRQLYVEANSDLDLTLKDVTAQPPDSVHHEHSIYIHNNSGKYLLENVTVQDSNYFGIYVISHTGDVTLQSVDVDNSADDNIEISGINGTVTLNNVISSNSIIGYGVALFDILGKKGVNFNDVVTTGNYDENIFINGVTADVTIIDSEAFSSDNGYGVFIDTVHGKKGVIINNTDSNDNHGYNFAIQNIDNSVLMENITANNSTAMSGMYMQHIYGKKGASLKTVTADGNAGNNFYFYDFDGGVTLSDIHAYGADLQGIYGADIRGSKGVSISDADVSTNNDSNIDISNIPNGPIILTNVTANESNGNKGINLAGILGSKGIKFSNVTASANHADNLSINNVAGDFSFKTGDCSDSDSGTGISLSNINGKKGATISDVTANHNYGTNVALSGIAGAVSISASTANTSVNNRGFNIISISGSKGVMLKGVTANENHGINFNISIITSNVSLSNVTAQSSAAGEGIYIINIQGSKGVGLSGVNANGNISENIHIENITGNVKMSGVESSNSTTEKGIYVNNVDGSSGVSLSNVTALDNELSNIWILDVTGNASLKTITTSGSDTGNGLYIYQIAGAKGVSMSNITAEDNENGNVLLDTISGDVSLKNIIASGSTSGAGLGIQYVQGLKGIKASNITASSNISTNFFIYDITGDVSLSGITATDSDSSSGGSIQKVYGSKGVTIKTADFSRSNTNNLFINHVSPGYVVLSGITANSSDTQYGLSVGNVDGVMMIKDGTFNTNNQSGISVSSLGGQLTLINVEASNNVNGDGAGLNTSNNQLVCSSTFNDNLNGYGLYGSAPGYSLTTSLVTASGNGTNQIFSPSGTEYNDSTKCKVIPAVTP